MFECVIFKGKFIFASQGFREMNKLYFIDNDCLSRFYNIKSRARYAIKRKERLK